MTATRGVQGALSRRRMELGDEVSDLNGGGVASPGGSARSRRVSPAGDVMPCRSDEVARAFLVFLMPKSWPGEASRPPVVFPGCARSVPAVSPVGDGQSECSGPERSRKRVGERKAERRGKRKRVAAVAKLVSQPRVRAEPCRHLARRERVRRLRLSPTQRKWRLGEGRTVCVSGTPKLYAWA